MSWFMTRIVAGLYAAWRAPILAVSMPAAARVLSGADTKAIASAVSISWVTIAEGTESSSSGAFASHSSDGARNPSNETRSSA